MAEIADFFFGTLYSKDNTVTSIGLHRLLERTEYCKPAHFTAQLRRVIGEHGNLEATDGTSAPPFMKLLKGLDLDHVGMLQIKGRRDVNENTGTLSCTLFFVEGTLEVSAHWCAWKELRASEIISTLLGPLITMDLLDRTLILDNGMESGLPKDSESLVQALFRLAGTPYNVAIHGPMSDYTNSIDGLTRPKEA